MKIRNGPLVKADKISGLESNLFSMSMVLEIMPGNNKRNKFKIPFYALTYKAQTRHADEWILDALYIQETEKLLKHIKDFGLAEFIKVKKTAKKESDEFLELAKKIITSLLNLTNQELVKTYDLFMEKYISFFSLGVVTFIYEHIVSEKFDQILRKDYGLTTVEVSALMQNPYSSFMIDNEKLLSKINNEKDTGIKSRLVEKYKREFFFMGTSYTYRKAITVSDILSSSKKSHYSALKHAKPIVRLSKEDAVVLKLFHQTEAIHDLRKRTNFIGTYTMYRFLDEAVKRGNVPLPLAENIFWFEYKELLANPKKMVQKLKKRKQATLLFINNKKIYSEKILVTERKSAVVSTELRGTPASAGKVKGKVKLIIGPKDFGKFKRGDILVTEMTRPDFVPVMKKASAIITDEGGLTCHAAIISRELNIPCIVGTKSATRYLKDGDVVEVNADIGIVNKI